MWPYLQFNRNSKFWRLTQTNLDYVLNLSLEKALDLNAGAGGAFCLFSGASCECYGDGFSRIGEAKT